MPPKRPMKKSKNKTKAPKGGRAKPRRKTRNLSTTPRTKSGPVAVSAPSSVGFVLPRSSFGFAGPAQKLADYDNGSSLRVRGCDLFSLPIKAGSSTAAAGFGGTGTYYAFLSPSLISGRLGAVEEMFQWWAFRSIQVIYIPTCGSSTAVSVAIGFATDAEMTGAVAAPTQQQVLEMNPSLVTPAWQVASMSVTHGGTKLWESYAASGEEGDTKFQGVFAATLLGAGTSTTYGQLWMDYTVDFYQQIPLLSSVDRRAGGRLSKGAVAELLRSARTPSRGESKDPLIDGEADECPSGDGAKSIAPSVGSTPHPAIPPASGVGSSPSPPGARSASLLVRGKKE